MKNEPEEFAQYDEKYMRGAENKALRYYFYLSNGLNVLNSFRNLGLGIIAIYFALHLENIWWMVGMGAVSTVLLTVVGFHQVHRAGKVLEWVGIRFSTHFGVRTFNNTQRNVELLEEIRDLLKKNHEST